MESELQKWQEQVLYLTRFKNNKITKAMKTVNNVSGGRTSAYLAAHYPADFNLFALVRTNDKDCMYPDAKLRQIVSDKIGVEFIGTLEDDKIIHTILDLEQYLGQEIEWITSEYAFEDIIVKKKAVPNVSQRFCTSMLKIVPMQQWWYKNFDEPIEVRLGFRANEQGRKKNTLASLNERGFVPAKVVVGKHENGNNKWKEFDWQKPAFPLIDNGIFKDDVENYWKDKPVRFAPINNCVGCFHQEPILLRKRFDWHPNKMEWFIKQEQAAENLVKKINGQRSQYTKWKSQFLYEQIKNHKLQLDIFESDFNECDSGYCGL
jgi:hypothetical protein